MAGRCIGGDQQYLDQFGKKGVTKQVCLEAGGAWESDGGICFVRDVLTRSLGETILELGTTYKIALEFRDKILAPTHRGKYFLDHYYANLDQTLQAVRDNYVLIGNFIEVWLTLLPWVIGMLEAKSDGEWKGKDQYVNRVRFSKELHKRCASFLIAFKKSAPNEQYASLLDEVKAEIDLYRGKTPHEALKILSRDTGKSDE